MSRSQAVTLVLLVFCLGIHDARSHGNAWSSLQDAMKEKGGKFINGLQEQQQKLEDKVESGKATWKLIHKNDRRINKVESELSTISNSLRSLERAVSALTSQPIPFGKDKYKRMLKGVEDEFHRKMSLHERLIKTLDRQKDQMQKRLNQLEKTASSSTQNCNELRQRVERNGNEIKEQKKLSRQQDQLLMAEMTKLRSAGHNKGYNNYKLPAFPGKYAQYSGVQEEVNRLQAQVSGILAAQNAEKAKNEQLFALMSHLQNQKLMGGKVDPTGNVQPKYHKDGTVVPSGKVQPNHVKAPFTSFAKEDLHQMNVGNLTAAISDLQHQVQRLQGRPYVGHCEVGIRGLRWDADGKTGYGGTGTVEFSKPFRTVPVVSAALYSLYHPGNQAVGIVVGTESITEKGFLVKIYGWDQTKLYSAGVQWMACG